MDPSGSGEENAVPTLKGAAHQPAAAEVQIPFILNGLLKCLIQIILTLLVFPSPTGSCINLTRSCCVKKKGSSFCSTYSPSTPWTISASRASSPPSVSLSHFELEGRTTRRQDVEQVEELVFDTPSACVLRHSISRCHHTNEEAEHRHGRSQSMGVFVRRAGRLGASTDIQEHAGDIFPGLCIST